MASRVSQLLIAWREGDSSARDELIPLVYDDLRALAHRHARGERQVTFQPTALIHEAFLRLVGSEVQWTGRAHFFAVASGMIRRILVDEARRRQALKRGAGEIPMELDEALLSQQRPTHLLQLEDALLELESLAPRQARVVELRFFGGLTIAEASKVLELSDTTVERDLRLAKAWLAAALDARHDAPNGGTSSAAPTNHG